MHARKHRKQSRGLSVEINAGFASATADKLAIKIAAVFVESVLLPENAIIR